MPCRPLPPIRLPAPGAAPPMFVSADLIAVGPSKQINALAAIRGGTGARGIGADVVPGDEVVTAAADFDPITRKAIDDQAADGAAGSRDLQAVYSGAGTRPVQLDDRRERPPRLLLRVDHHRPAERRQRGSRAG